MKQREKKKKNETKINSRLNDRPSTSSCYARIHRPHNPILFPPLPIPSLVILRGIGYFLHGSGQISGQKIERMGDPQIESQHPKKDKFGLDQGGAKGVVRG